MGPTPEWTAAEQHHQKSIRIADEASYRTLQPISRDWYAWMLLQRGDAGDKDRARALLGMPQYAKRASANCVRACAGASGGAQLALRAAAPSPFCACSSKRKFIDRYSASNSN